MSAHNIPSGSRMVSTWMPTEERRKTPAEMRRMSHLDQLLYFIEHGPPTNDQDRHAALELEDQIHQYGLHGDVLVGSILWDDGPGDWDE